MVLAACSATPTPDLEATVQAAVAATQAAQPTNTFTPEPTNTPTPEPTDTPTLDPTRRTLQQEAVDLDAETAYLEDMFVYIDASALPAERLGYLFSVYEGNDPALVRGLQRVAAENLEIYRAVSSLVPPPALADYHDAYVESMRLQWEGTDAAVYAVEHLDVDRMDDVLELLDQSIQFADDAAYYLKVYKRERGL